MIVSEVLGLDFFAGHVTELVESDGPAEVLLVMVDHFSEGT